MRSFLIICMLFFSTQMHGQELNKYDKCPGDRIFSKAEHMPVYKKGLDSLAVFFNKKLSSIEPANSGGTLTLAMIICSSGSARLQSMINKTDFPVSEKLMKEMVLEMPLWKPAIQNGYEVDCQVTIELIIEHGVVTAIQYKRNA
jgi:hypothetical protein